MTPSLSTACASAAEPTREALDAVVQHLLAAPDDAARRSQLLAALADFPAAALLIHLKTASEHYFTVNARQSLCLADALIVAAELAAQPQHRALGLLARGDALRTLGQYRAAHDTFEEAGADFLALGDEVGWARTRTGWLAACFFLGLGAEALPTIEQAHSILSRYGEWQRAAGLDQNAANVCELLGRYDKALLLYERAEATFSRVGAAAAQGGARARANRARLLCLFGDFRLALSLHEEARALFLDQGAMLSVHRQDQYIADVFASQGDYTQALHRYSEALAAFDAEDQIADAVWTMLSMVECYLRLNRLHDAHVLAEEAIERCERHGTSTEAARARVASAIALVRMGDRDRAGALLADATAIFAAAGLVGHGAVVSLHQALLLLGDEQWLAAGEAATHAEQRFAADGLPLRQMQATLVRARALLGRGAGGAAATLARGILAAGEERELPWLAHEAHAIIGGAARQRGDDAAALAAYDAAIGQIERVQGRLAVELRTAFLADKLQVYHEAIDCCLRLPQPDIERAYTLLERAKSRALVDYLASNPVVQPTTLDSADRALADSLRQLRAEHDWFTDRLYGHRLTIGGGGPLSSEEAAALQGQIAQRERQIARLSERLTLRQGGGAAERSPAQLTQEDLRRALDPQTVLVEYHLYPERSVAFAMTAEGLTLVPLSLRLPDLHRLIQRWQLNLTATARALSQGQSLALFERNAQALLRSLYRALVAPLADTLKGCGRLVIIPTGPLHQLPFHAFHDEGAHLVERYEVVVAPSAALHALCTSRPVRSADGALVLGHSDEGRLPAAVTEALLVSTLLPGRCCLEAQATREALVRYAPEHRILHLAAHGAARLDNPLFAHIRLADGRLSPADIFALDLAGMLVVLSACETGRAAVQGGDELLGLSRAFLHAGANALVQSLWRVEDSATARLMSYFYAGLRDGAAAGAALRAAQLALLGAGLPVYHWAAFQLLGHGGLVIGG